SGARPQSGSGLGLAVARGLVAAHRGRIWAENRPGGGASFTFDIPGNGTAQ
ncbi:MAG TPA: ATP-binding protein, partial [Candidatus Dormibacteraeota bacterium]|nr:ATP-binding protein [Candidatus Dormibacteraeota bacterium]